MWADQASLHAEPRPWDPDGGARTGLCIFSSVMRPLLSRRACAAGAALALNAVLLSPTPGLIPQPVAASGNNMLDTPAWVTTDNGASLQRMSDANRRLDDKGAKRVFNQAVELADRAADEYTQVKDDAMLARAEERFTLLIEDLAPNYCYAYTNRANVRVARGDYNGAVADYTRALELAPLSNDAWLTCAHPRPAAASSASRVLRMRRPPASGACAAGGVDNPRLSLFHLSFSPGPSLARATAPPPSLERAHTLPGRAKAAPDGRGTC